MDRNSNAKPRHLLLSLFVLALSSIGAGCATTTFSSYVTTYMPLPEPKAMMCATDSSGAWTCGTGQGADVVEAEIAARAICENGRRTYRITAPCLLARINDMAAEGSERGGRLRFRYYARECNRSIAPKVMACAFDNEIDWACSMVSRGPSLEQIKRRALDLCANERFEKSLSAECEVMAANVSFTRMPWEVEPPPQVMPKPVAPPTEDLISTGTCFAVSGEGRLLTAAHVVQGALRIDVSFNGQHWYPATVDVQSESLDIAVLTTGVDVAEWVPLAPGDVAMVGDDVFTFGFPVIDWLGIEPKYAAGSISALSGYQGDFGFMQITVPVQPGNSGGPLFNFSGQVVGVVVSKAAAAPFLDATGTLPENIGWAVKSAMVQPFVGSPAPPPLLTTRREVIDRAQRSVCIVKTSRPSHPQ